MIGFSICRNIETYMETLTKDLNYLSDKDGSFKETVTNDVSGIKDELLRFQGKRFYTFVSDNVKCIFVL